MWGSRIDESWLVSQAGICIMLSESELGLILHCIKTSCNLLYHGFEGLSFDNPDVAMV